MSLTSQTIATNTRIRDPEIPLKDDAPKMTNIDLYVGISRYCRKTSA
ncbi:hypothetical protein RM545_02585 [Zunongwangia sp. F260]|uniref:Uncharacterized protein n=1 Tax=Autumnicola lenta TaxID=3075593 RepID=A0ABU3CGZ7_9FLAO|nr:hypothetical protein [Zunongwangia sp. F260]MDT0645566.1 hypothetical protein [Zunongwangia sp. F260]